MAAPGFEGSFSYRVYKFVDACFGRNSLENSPLTRSHRFLEEALELVQACGCPIEHAHLLVDYVFSRPIGEPSQELGGVMVTLQALANTKNLAVDVCADKELARCWEIIHKIRAKQAAKHSLFGPLP